MMLMMTFTRAVCVCEHALLNVLRREAGLVCCVEYGDAHAGLLRCRGVLAGGRAGAGYWRVYK